jgi:hypothetical protein
LQLFFLDYCNKKGTELPCGKPFLSFLMLADNYSPGMIASLGQTSAQLPHSMQVSESIL